MTDGLRCHESDLRIAEHYTDTAGFTDHLFAVMPLLSYRFAPRIRDLSDTKLYVPPGSPAYTKARSLAHQHQAAGRAQPEPHD